MTSSDSIAYDSLQPAYSDIFNTDLLLITTCTHAPNSNKQKPHTPLLGDWAIVSFTALLIVLASLRITSEKYLISIIQSIFNRQTAQRLYRESVFNLMHPALRLDILFFFSFGLFLFQIEEILIDTFYLKDPILFLINTGCILVFVYSKIFIYQLTGFIFACQNEIKEYLFYTKTGSRVLGIFLFPIAILMFFTQGIWSNILLFLGVGTILLFSVISLFRGIRIIAQKDFSIYYLILYLCSLEILPLLIVWRILWSM